MGSESHYQIPVMEFSIDSREVERGSDQWYQLCKKVREACENYGCFEAVYDKIPQQLRSETFFVSKQLFSLPLETKKENLDPNKPTRGYLGQIPRIPLYESFGFEDASNYESLRSLTEKYLPNGHDKFCTVNSMIKQLAELRDMINLMILDSYGLGSGESNLFPESYTVVRTMKYAVPPTRDFSIGIDTHTDKAWSAILCDDQVSGLELETKGGQWVKLSLSPTSYVFIVGDLLMAWSNGRMHAVKHRAMCGEKERYSLASFVAPIDGAIIKPPKEVIDEQYPRILEDFDYTDFYNFLQTVPDKKRAMDSEKLIFEFAGISN